MYVFIFSSLQQKQQQLSLIERAAWGIETRLIVISCCSASTFFLSFLSSLMSNFSHTNFFCSLYFCSPWRFVPPGIPSSLHTQYRRHYHCTTFSSHLLVAISFCYVCEAPLVSSFPIWSNNISNGKTFFSERKLAACSYFWKVIVVCLSNFEPLTTCLCVTCHQWTQWLPE